MRAVIALYLPGPKRPNLSARELFKEGALWWCTDMSDYEVIIRCGFLISISDPLR